MDDCNGCVHEKGYNPNYLGNCDDCIRNPKLVDCYYKERVKESLEKEVKRGLKNHVREKG